MRVDGSVSSAAWILRGTTAPSGKEIMYVSQPRLKILENAMVRVENFEGATTAAA